MAPLRYGSTQYCPACRSVQGGAPMRRRNISALNLKMPGAESERRVGAGEGPPAEAG